MPSPTSSTRPTSTTSTLLLYCSISLVRTEAISLALNLMTASHEDLIADVLEFRTHRGIVLPIADADANAGDQLGIGFQLEDGLEAPPTAKLFLQMLALIVGERDGGGYFHPDAAVARTSPIAQRRQDPSQQLRPLLGVQYKQEIEDQFACLAANDVADDLLAPAAADRGPGQQHFQLGLILEDIENQPVQLFEDGVALALFLRGIEQSLRVNAGHALRGHVGACFQIFDFVVVHLGSGARRQRTLKHVSCRSA